MHHPYSSQLRRWLIAGVFLGSALITACSTGSSKPTTPAASTITVDISAAKGGTITNGKGATLSIPAGALSTDAKVTLADVGMSSQQKGDPLIYLTDGFAATAQPDTGNTPVTLNAPLHLDLLGKAPEDAQLLVIGAIEPDKAGIHIHAGDTTSNAQKQGIKYTALGNIDWIIKVPRLTQHPTEKLILQMPWYDQNGLPWCAPTSLTENLRYYDFSETSDPLDATFGQSTALANWQLTGATHQAAGSGGWYDGATSVGVPFESSTDSGSGPRFVVYQWDADFFFSSPGDDSTSAAQDLKFESFVTYVTLVNTGLFGFFDRKPVVMDVDAWWHSVDIVGVDGDGAYITNSNGGIAQKMTWLNLANQASVWQTDDHGAPVRKHLIWTGVVYGLPIKPTEKREGSMVLVQGGVNLSDTHNNPVALAWDGAAPHNDGYYFRDDVDTSANATLLGMAGVRNQPLTYSYRVANVSDTPLTFHAVAELADQNYGHIINSQATDVTVPAYSVSDPIAGSFPNLPSGNQGVFVVRLLERGSSTVNQDVKFVRFNIADPLPIVAIPSVIITLPKDASVFDNVSPNGQTITLSATGSNGVIRYLWSDSIQGNLGTGASLQANLTFPQYGNCAVATHVITVTAYDNTGQTAKASATVTLRASCIK